MHYKRYTYNPAESTHYYTGVSIWRRQIGKMLTIDDMLYLMDRHQHVEYFEEDKNLFCDEQTGKYYTENFYHTTWESLTDHLLAEKCVANRDQLDWKRTTHDYDFSIIAFIKHTYEHPLVWKKCVWWWYNPGKFPELESFTDIVYRPDYPQEVADLWTRLYNESLLYFADNMPKVDREWPFRDRYSRTPNGFVAWDRLFSTKYEIKAFPRFDNTDPEKFREELFNPQTFRANLRFIAENRGETKALELVQRLRQDWSEIVTHWYFQIEDIPPRRVEAFRKCLFDWTVDELSKQDVLQETEPEQAAITLEALFPDGDIVLGETKHMCLMRYEDNEMFLQWERFGFDWNKSYTEWIYLFATKGYHIKVLFNPQRTHWLINNQISYGAVFVAVAPESSIKFKLYFRSVGEDIFESLPGTLYRMHIMSSGSPYWEDDPLEFLDTGNANWRSYLNL